MFSNVELICEEAEIDEQWSFVGNKSNQRWGFYLLLSPLLVKGVLGLKDRKSFRERYLVPALSEGLIEMTLPDKPNSSLQKYYLTKLGKQLAG